MTDTTQQPEEQTGSDEPVKLPYLAFTTFKNFLDEKIANGTPPPRIDKSFLESYSGANQALLLSTLKFFGLIEENGRVDPKLIEIAQDEDERKRFLATKLPELYPGIIELANESATGQQLAEWFQRTGYGGSTLRKAMRFYLQTAEYAGLPTSPNFKVPKADSNTRRRRQTPGAGSSGASTSERGGADGDDEDDDTGTVYTFRIGEAGSVTVTVDVDVFKLTKSDRDKLFGLIDLLGSFESEDAEIDDDEDEEDGP